MGKAVAEFCKNLKEAGIPLEAVITMPKDYLGTLTKRSVERPLGGKDRANDP